jgi:Ca2+-transporting ATPase
MDGDAPADHLFEGLPSLSSTPTRANGSFAGDPTRTAQLTTWLPGKRDARRGRALRLWAKYPFDSERKAPTVIIVLPDGRQRVQVKGAPESAGRCTHRLSGDTAVPLTDPSDIEQANESMARRALRVLAFSFKDVAQADPADIPGTESGLTFCGLVGMIDPPREEARAAIETCRQAGILPVMITGDHNTTAAAIAGELGILGDGRRVVTGAELEQMSDEDLFEQVSSIAVYARVAPEHKSRIVAAWQKKGKVVSMTGDGVNDAPALKAADIGVGMGITGTDVSKGASDMVLTDDNFATIVVAVREGRRIFDNIHKAVRFLLSSNTGEVLTMLAATLAVGDFKTVHPLDQSGHRYLSRAGPWRGTGGGRRDEPPSPRQSRPVFFRAGLASNWSYGRL